MSFPIPIDFISYLFVQQQLYIYTHIMYNRKQK